MNILKMSKKKLARTRVTKTVLCFMLLDRWVDTETFIIKFKSCIINFYHSFIIACQNSMSIFEISNEIMHHKFVISAIR